MECLGDFRGFSSTIRVFQRVRKYSLGCTDVMKIFNVIKTLITNLEIALDCSSRVSCSFRAALLCSDHVGSVLLFFFDHYAYQWKPDNVPLHQRDTRSLQREQWVAEPSR